MKLCIRDTDGKREGPGNNIFSKSNVTNEGNILKMKVNDKSSEVYYDKIPYGNYEFTLKKPLLLPKGVIFSFFLYEDDEHEYDIEYGRWGKFFNKTLQFADQSTNQIERHLELSRTHKVSIDYQKDFILFKTNQFSKKYLNHNLTKPNLHINLWKLKDTNVPETKIIIKNFKYERA